MKAGALQRVYFPMTDKNSLRRDVAERLKWEVDRSSYGNKIRDLLAWTKDIHEDIEAQRIINSNKIGSFLVHNWSHFNYVAFFMTCLLNAFMIAAWSVDVHRKQKSQEDWIFHHESLDIIWRISGAIHVFFSSLLVVSYFLSNLAGFKSSLRTYKRKLLGIKDFFNACICWNRSKPKLREDGKEKASKLEVDIIGGQVIYYVGFLILSVLGFTVSPFFYAFHLLQLVNTNQLLKRVIQAVTQNGKSLLLVGLLGLILIYIHAIIGFLAFRNLYFVNKHMCNSLFQCTISTIREGLLYRIMRIDYPVKVGAPKGHNLTEFVENNYDSKFYTLKLIWDLSFFVIVLTIGLNVIFGIIVDTFRELRNAKWKIDEDEASRCFICGRSSYEFEQKRISFSVHTSKEHNLHAYVFFLIRLSEMPAENLSHLEIFCKKLVESDNYTIFPMGEAISLTGYQEATEALQMDMLIMSKVDTIMAKMEAEEVRKQREKLQKMQKQWQVTHKGKRSGKGQRRPPEEQSARSTRLSYHSDEQVDYEDRKHVRKGSKKNTDIRVKSAEE